MSGEAKDKKEVLAFDPSWNDKAGKFDTRAEYVASFREPRGFRNGAKISKPIQHSKEVK